jgi:DegV family protein with EDD domain
MNLVLETDQNLDIHIVPHAIALAGKVYRSEIDIDCAAFYRLLDETGAFPTTSLPSPGDFSQMYRQLATTDADILSIHMSSGLSGTEASARAGAAMVPEARVTVYDTKTLSAVQGWLVEAAVRAVRAGWPLERIIPLLDRLAAACESVYTLTDLKYLIHGGRISHMKGLIGAALHLKPIIAVEKVGGTYEQMGIARTEKSALQLLVKQMERRYPAGSALRVQILHGDNPEGANQLHALADAVYDCHWLPAGRMTVVLGAHTGPTMVGIAYGPEVLFRDLP